MTPELHLSGADARLGSSRLSEAHDPPALTSARRSLTHDRPPIGRLAAARMDGVTQRSIERHSDETDVEEAEVTGPALTLDAQQLEQVGSLFKLLSDKTRLAILQILCEGEMNVTTLCRRMKLPQPTVSHHLGLLRMNRLIANRRSGKQVYYKLHDRVKPVMLPQGDDGKVKLDGANREVGEHPTGLQIVDDRFALQIITHRPSAGAIYPKLESAPVHANA